MTIAVDLGRKATKPTKNQDFGTYHMHSHSSNLHVQLSSGMRGLNHGLVLPLCEQRRLERLHICASLSKLLLIAFSYMYPISHVLAESFLVESLRLTLCTLGNFSYFYCHLLTFFQN